MRPTSRKPSEAARPRMAPLAKLPVFFDLAGKRAIVAGGSDAAAWKAELLASAGAEVVVFADQVTDEMSELLKQGASSGSLTLVSRTGNGRRFAGCRFVRCRCL